MTGTVINGPFEPGTIIDFKDGSKAMVCGHVVTETGRTNYTLLPAPHCFRHDIGMDEAQAEYAFYLTQEEIGYNAVPFIQPTLH